MKKNKSSQTTDNSADFTIKNNTSPVIPALQPASPSALKNTHTGSDSTFKIGEVTITGEKKDSNIQAKSSSSNNKWDTTTTVPDPNWTYMCKGNKETVSLGLDDPKINSKLKDANTNTYTIISLVDMDVTIDETSTNQPIITTYTKNNVDTLFVIISYTRTVTYASKTITFDISITKPNQVFYLLQDDPKTSRGTVTNVQSSTTICEEEKLMKLH
ncbi:MAG: hypothetical protein HRT58_00230 [Crocinitomicaceae bacterium]|nr:hypothetical protein [Flavobacteriales bacterium]NQZ34047.1 hypothetical protein [Crocinitomicaceae bacterium]